MVYNGIDYGGLPGSEGPGLRVLSLFSGCGGMDLGFEGGFLAPAGAVEAESPYIYSRPAPSWVLLRRTRFRTVFANDILPEARRAWLLYMRRFGVDEGTYHTESVVELVKRAQAGEAVFPKDVDVVTGGFPCQDFSVAGKRLGFASGKDHLGHARQSGDDEGETRGRLYQWMRQVVELTRPRVFLAENVKGLTNLGDAKQIIEADFGNAAGQGYLVLPPRVLHAADYGVPESRERVIFIGLRRDALQPSALAALSGASVPPEWDPYPAPTHGHSRQEPGLLPTLTCQDVLGGLPEPEVATDPAQRVYSKARYIGPGSQGQTEIDLHGLGPTIRSEHHGNIEYRRLSAEHGGRHAEELARGLCERRLTPRECALIQTFPPDYPFVVPAAPGSGPGLSASAAYKVIGNAVPPLLAWHLARRLEQVWPRLFG